MTASRTGCFDGSYREDAVKGKVAALAGRSVFKPEPQLKAGKLTYAWPASLLKS